MLLTQGHEAHETLLQKQAREDEDREEAVRAVMAGLGRMATPSASRGRDRARERVALEGGSGAEADLKAQRPGISREATNLGAGALVESLATPASSNSFYLTQQSPQS